MHTSRLLGDAAGLMIGITLQLAGVDLKHLSGAFAIAALAALIVNKALVTQVKNKIVERVGRKNLQENSDDIFSLYNFGIHFAGILFSVGVVAPWAAFIFTHFIYPELELTVALANSIIIGVVFFLESQS